MDSSIDDFGRQWSRYRDPLGAVESEAFLADILGPLMSLDDVAGRHVADIGAGNGRLTAILARRAASVLSLEPSAAMVNNRARNGQLTNVQFSEGTIETLTARGVFDFVFCIGVLHHITDMGRALSVIRESLRPGGRLVLWVYGRERVGLYLALVRPLRWITVRMPDSLLHALASVLVWPVKLYRSLCRHVPRMPMAGYFNGVLSWCADATLRVVIFDQLNPRTARYMTRAEVDALLQAHEFSSPRFHHRHGYRWTAVADRPLSEPSREMAITDELR